jgi:hypothetical protein
MRQLFKNIFIFALLTSILLTASVSAIESNLSYSTASDVQIRKMKYEPYPVNPGEYFDFWIEVTYTGTSGSDIVFELDPQYPFSLDPNENALREYTGNAKSVVLNYKIRVDKDAIEGTNQLSLRYKISGIWYTKVFDIEVSDAQTSFDAVIQDVSDSEISMAIANVGKNTANSVIVKIPEQAGFKTTGTNGQMVGNLESGDYTIVSFSITKIPIKNSKSTPNLKFNIYYTDNIGERREVPMELPLEMGASLNNTFSGRIPGMTRQQAQNESFLSKYGLWIVILVVVVVILYIWKKHPEKIKAIFSKLKLSKKKKGSSFNIPEWIAKEKSKEKSF